MEEAANHLDVPAGASDPGRHVVVVGRSRMNRRYQIVRRGGARSWLVMWTLEGAGAVVHDSVEAPAEVGDLVVLAPQVPQRYRTAGEGWDFLWAHFHARPAWPALLRPFELGRGLHRIHVGRGKERSRITKAFDRAARDARLDGPSLVGRRADPVERSAGTGVERVRASTVGSTDLVLNAIEEVLLVATRAGRADGAPSARGGVAAAWSAIVSDPAAPHTVASLAATAAMSPSHFAHRFRRETGTTPMNAVRDERLAVAAQMLRSTDMAVAQVARAVGYRDPFYFSRLVRTAFGAAPSMLAGSSSGGSDDVQTRCQDKLR